MKDEELLNFNDTTYAYVDPTYDRQYVNPEISQNEQLQFIDTLRGLQAQNNAQINQQTYNLGTQVPSNLGGLTGSEGVWQARYQTPQLDATVANLQNTTRQTALNTALANQEAMWKNRYNQAKRALEKAQHKYNTSGDGGTPEGDAQLVDADEDQVTSRMEGTTVAPTLEGDAEVITDNKTGDVIGVTGQNWGQASISIGQIQSKGGVIHQVIDMNDSVVRIIYMDKNGKFHNQLFYTDKWYGK